MAETKMVSYRLPVELVDALGVEAARNEEPVSALVIRLLQRGLGDGEMAHVQLRPKPGGGSTVVERVSRVRGFSAMGGEPIMTKTGPAPAPVKAGVAKAAKGKVVAE